MSSKIHYPVEGLLINAEQPLQDLITELKVSLNSCQTLFRLLHVEIRYLNSAMKICSEKGVSNVSVKNVKQIFID